MLVAEFGEREADAAGCAGYQDCGLGREDRVWRHVGVDVGLESNVKLENMRSGKG